MFDDLFNKLKKTNEFITKEQIYALYEQVSHEIESGKKDTGVWTKAYADARGDLQMQKALYIEMMVERYALAGEAQEELKKKEADQKKKQEQEAQQTINSQRTGKIILTSILFLPFQYICSLYSGFLSTYQLSGGGNKELLIALFLAIFLSWITSIYVIEESENLFYTKAFLKLIILSLLAIFSWIVLTVLTLAVTDSTFLLENKNAGSFFTNVLFVWISVYFSFRCTYRIFLGKW